MAHPEVNALIAAARAATQPGDRTPLSGVGPGASGWTLASTTDETLTFRAPEGKATRERIYREGRLLSQREL